MELLADVIVDRVVDALDHPFTYRVPKELEDKLQAGQLVTVPFGSSQAAGVVRRLYQEEAAALANIKEIRAIRQLLPVLTPGLLELADWMADRYMCFLAQAVRAMIPVSVRQDRAVRPPAVWYRAVGVRQGRPTIKQRVFEYVAEQEAVDRRSILDTFPNAQAALRALVAEGALEVLTRPPSGTLPSSARHPLSEAQQRALDRIVAGPERAWLLEGVTGSGKTEVYLALIERALAVQQQGLVLLPEIALTPQIVARFRERFGDRVAVWHSGLSAGERRLTWEGVRQEEIGVVVGARSATFLPFPNLGVIVVDEEHEPSYKQEEHPRYHTREVALWRGKNEGAIVVLGSATPAVETRHQAESGSLGHVRLPERILGRGMPRVALVDMREELKAGNREIFSGLLKRALGETLDRGEQAILFLNRRGYSTFVLCRSCGQALECPDCAVSLTFHQGQNELRCHYCLKVLPVPSQCPECGSEKIRYFGAGTERVVSEVERLFPAARILRADRDTLTRAQDYSDLYYRFYQGEGDVLVGTQMIAKGMDFPRVTLVGVVAADTALHLPDYRSAERTFQLLVQAGGRSGRGDAEGQVVIQTYNPEHYAIHHAQNHDYAAFYEEEIAFRSATRYPPFTELWLLAFEGSGEREVAARSEAVAESLREAWPGAEVLGPAPAPLARVRGQYRYHVLVKTGEGQPPQQLAHDLRTLQSQNKGISITRDPYFLM